MLQAIRQAFCKHELEQINTLLKICKKCLKEISIPCEHDWDSTPVYSRSYWGEISPMPIGEDRHCNKCGKEKQYRS